jgi:DNA repair exonuclease SbcCD nuclease subunit
MKLLHTGDLHLDSAFCSSDVLTAESRREAQRKTFARIMGLASSEKCDIVLIAGDLFDGRYVTPETEKFVKDIFEHAEMPVVIAPGNHDPYSDGSFYKTELPEGVYVFTSNELQRYDFDELDLSVYGYAFTSSVLGNSPLASVGSEPREKRYSVLCAHGDLDSPISRYCPLTEGDISSMDIDYAALGHIHNRIDGTGRARYCGFPQGRSFDELHDGGVNIVEIDEKGELKVERRIVSIEKYEIAEVYLDGSEDRAGIISKIRAAAISASDGKNTHLRLVLTGSADEESLPSDDSITEELKNIENILSADIKNATLPVADASELRADVSIRGALYNALYSGLVDEDPAVRAKTALALRIGLSAIEGKRIFGGKESE